MITKLTRHNGNLAIEIDPAMAEKLGLREDTDVEVRLEGGGLIVFPAGDEERRRKFREALEDTNRKYGGMLKRLAE